MNDAKQKTWIKRWGGTDAPLVNFYHKRRLWATDSEAQMHYDEWLRLFGIPLEPEVVYSFRVKGTVKRA